MEKKNMIKNILKKLAVFMLAAFIAVPALTPEVFAASSLTVTGGDEVKGGETFTVTVTYSGDDLGRVSGSMTYDTSMLTYISGGSSSGNVGHIQLKNAGIGEDLVFQLKFQAVTEGTATLNVSTNEMYDLSENYMDVPAATTKTINISGNAAEEELIVEEADPEEEFVDMSVDEKTDEPANTTTILLIGAAVVVVLIIVIAVVLGRKRKK